MRPVRLFRSPATAMLAVSLALAACASATPSATPVFPAVREAAGTPSPTQAPAPDPSPTSTPVVVDDQMPDQAFYADVPVVLEMRRDCGLCGPEGWIADLPRFRLYADGLAVYRHIERDPQWLAPYHFVELDDDDMEFLLRYALDEGGLRGADPHYSGDSDDAGSMTFVLHGWPVDEDVDIEVVVEPVIGDGTTDVNGNPLSDPSRRELFGRLEELLSNFGTWAQGRGLEGTPYDPESYAAALFEARAGEGEPWPWHEPTQKAFAQAGFGQALARITREQSREAGGGPGGADLGDREIGDGRIGTLLVRPVLPGDDRPGAFGIRPDTVAITVEPELRVRSLPEVSDASVRYEPLLDRGDALYVIGGPVEGSGYRWYQVYAPRTEQRGWVAAASKSGEPWIEPVIVECTLGASAQEIVDKVGYDLMHLACYSGVEFSGTYRLAPYPVPNEHELTCPDEEYIAEPAWLNTSLSCFYDFGPQEADTGSYDLPARGVLHPSLAEVPDELLGSSPGGLAVEVRGQLDHPDSRGCTSHGTDPARETMVQLRCRTTFVITELRAAD